jgi:hypothetical protein
MADARITDLTVVAGANLATGDEIVIADVSDVTDNAAGSSRSTTLGDVATFLQGGRGASVVKQLGSDVTLTTTHAKATNLDQSLAAGTWVFEYHVVYRSDTTSVGAVFGVNFTGTQTTFVCEGTQFEATTAASTGAADQVHATVGLRSGGAQRAPSNTAAGACVGSTSVDTASADMYIVIRGLTVVTVAGNLELWGSKEAAGTGVQTLRTPSSLIATRIV